MPASFWTDPLVYQGGSDDLLGARDDVLLPNEEDGIDLEAEVAVITDDIALGSTAQPVIIATRLRPIFSNICEWFALGGQIKTFPAISFGL